VGREKKSRKKVLTVAGGKSQSGKNSGENKYHGISPKKRTEKGHSSHRNWEGGKEGGGATTLGHGITVVGYARAGRDYCTSITSKWETAVVPEPLGEKWKN